MKIELAELRAFEALSVFLRECEIETCEIEYKGEHLYNSSNNKHFDFIVNSVRLSIPCLSLPKIKSEGNSASMICINGQWDFWGAAIVRFTNHYSDIADSPMQETPEEEQEEQPQTLLERTGYSYSGISDIIHNEPESTKELIQQIDEKYNYCVRKQEEIERELERAKSARGMCVRAFIHVHSSLKLGEEPLVFEARNMTGWQKEMIVVKIKDQNTIDYQKFPITVF